MAGIAMLIDEPIKGVVKEVNRATSNADFLKEAFSKEDLSIIVSVISCLALFRLILFFLAGIKN